MSTDRGRRGDLDRERRARLSRISHVMWPVSGSRAQTRHSYMCDGRTIRGFTNAAAAQYSLKRSVRPDCPCSQWYATVGEWEVDRRHPGDGARKGPLVARVTTDRPIPMCARVVSSPTVHVCARTRTSKDSDTAWSAYTFTDGDDTSTRHVLAI